MSILDKPQKATMLSDKEMCVVTLGMIRVVGNCIVYGT